MEPSTVGTLLRQYRTTMGLTQEALAARANLSTRAISDLERGLSHAPRFDTLDLLARALGLSAEQRAALFSAARPALPRVDAPARRRQVLPVPPTALIGRAEEVAHGLDLLRTRGMRLLTITGPGGVGKTRLALQMAHALCGDFADGLAWVELVAIRDPELVPQMVAQILSLREHPGGSVPEQVCAYLQDKQLLLLLDNFEQVPEAADFVADLLVRCPNLQVLVTSRVPLHLRAEQQLALSPLTPIAAVALFRERGQRVQLQLDMVSPTAAAICDQVDRLPLAIELAAAHAKTLTLPVLLERLGNRLQVLRGGARDLPERQRTMHGAIAWSYDLLTTTEQHWFRAVGTFVGGCTAAAVAAVGCGAERVAAEHVHVIMAALVDASLVQVEITGTDTSRYSLLEIIREYAVEQLRATGEEAQYQRRHAEYYARLAEAAERSEPAQGSREAQLESEAANGRAALHWASAQGEVALGLRLATWFGLFWMKRGQMHEGYQWLEQMLALDAAAGARVAPQIRCRALYYASRLALHLGRNDRATAWAAAALTLAQQAGDEADLSNVLAILGSIALAAGKEDEAGSYFTDSYAAAQRAGEQGAQGLALLNLGEIARRRGEFGRAREFLESSLAQVRAIDMTWGIANILTLLGHLARQQQDYTRAKSRYREGLAHYRRLGNATYTAWCFEGLAAVASAEQRYAQATRLCAAAAALRGAAHTPLPPAEQEDVDQIVLTARAELDEVTFTEAWRIGSTRAQDDAIADALMALPT